MDTKHIERLRRIASEYWQPSDVQLAVALSLKRIEQLEALTRSQAERIAAQSELLSKRAEA